MSEIRIKRSHIAAAKLKQDIAKRRKVQLASWILEIAGSEPTRQLDTVQVGTTQGDRGRARVRRYVATENVSTTGPLSHEEVRLERITDGNLRFGEDKDHDIVLHGEQGVVQTEAVPVERVRLSTETVTEKQGVTGQIGNEQAGGVAPRRGGQGRRSDSPD